MNRIIITYDELFEQYIIENKSCYECAEFFNCSGSKIKGLLKKYDLVKLKTPEQREEARQRKVKETNNKLYGCDWYTQTPELQIASHSPDAVAKRMASTEITCMEKYGTKHPFSSGSPVRELAKQALFDNHGVYYYFQSPEQWEKRDATRLELYGDAKYTNREKFANTMCSIYGENWRHELAMLGLRGFQAKYGLKCTFQLPWVIEKTHSPEVIEKQFETKKKNGTINTSNPEKEYYKYLKELFGADNVKTNYNKDPRYPFHCDFYIPSEDLFIELNLHFTHGPHIFNPDDINDLLHLEYIKSKQGLTKAGKKNSYYQEEEVWTVRDPLKIKYAIDNKLNYMIIYNEIVYKFGNCVII